MQKWDSLAHAIFTWVEKWTHIHPHPHTQHKTQYSIAQHTQTYACTKLNKAHIPVCIWHTHGQLSIYTAQTVCPYGTSMSNLPYTQHRLPIWHKHVQPSVHAAQTAYMAQACPTICTRSTDCLYGTSMASLLYTQHRLPIWHKLGQPSVHAAQTAYMAQACPTICTRSTDCLYGTSMSNHLYTQHKLPIWHKHVQPSVHAAQTVCLLVSDVMDITSVSLQLRVMQSSPQIWLQMSKSNVQALYCIYIYLQALGTPTCYATEENPPKSGHSTYLVTVLISVQLQLTIQLCHIYPWYIFSHFILAGHDMYMTVVLSKQTEHEKLTTRPL